ncbi:hypothetical protein ACHAPO_004449 [Fusarium lateritium]
MWEEEFAAQDVSGFVPCDLNFVPREEDWAEFLSNAPGDVPASGLPSENFLEKRKREEDEEEEKKEEKKEKKQKTAQSFFGIPAAAAPRIRT